MSVRTRYSGVRSRPHELHTPSVRSRISSTPDTTLVAHTEACYGFYDEGRAVEEIGVPALVVHGDADLIVPVENGRMLAARLPNAQYVELKRRGHNLMLEDPETFTSLVLDYLT